MANAALSLLAGFGGGYVSGQQRKVENDREDARMRMAQETHDLQQRSAQRDQDLQLKLVQAAAPAQVDVGAGGMTKPDYADNRDVGQLGEPGGEGGPALQQGTLVNGTPYTNPADAAAVATAYNDPSAVSLRQVQAYQQAGRPVDAMNLQKGAFQLTAEQQKYAKALRDENAAETAKAMVQGDPDAIRDAFNAKGKYKLVGDVKVTPRERNDIPGIDSLPTNDIEATMQMPDGTTKPIKVNSYDFATSLMPYHDFLTQQQKGQRNEDKADTDSKIADVREKLVKVQEKAVDQKIADAATRSKVTLTDAERKRWTATLNAASANLRTAEKALQSFQTDRLNSRAIAKNPSGPEALQFKQLQDAVAKHTSDYNDARSRLAAAPSGATPITSGSPSGAQPVPASKGDLKAGTVYQTSRGPALWNGTAFEQ